MVILMSAKISKEILKYALNCCSNIDNPYIFEDISQGRKMYIGVVVKKRPKIGKIFSFYGLNVCKPLFECASDITFEVPIEEVIQLSKTVNKEPLYYVSAGNQSAIIYVLSKDLISRSFENIFLVHFFAILSRNVTFNYDYLSRNNMLAIIHNNDIHSLIGNSLTYNPVRNGTIHANCRLKTPTIKKITPLPYASNMYIASFNKATSPNNYIILYNNSCSLNQTKDLMLKHSGHYCMLCGCYHEGVQWHHIVPRSLGGKNEYYNGCLLCPECHRFIHVCQDNYPNMFDNLTLRIIHNKPRIRLVYPQIKKSHVRKITF